MQNLDETHSTRPERDPKPEKEEGQLDQTQPAKIEEIARPAAEPEVEISDESLEGSPPPGKKKPRRRLGRTIFLGLLAVLILAIIGGLGGYQIALGDRMKYQESIIGTQVSDQFLLGLLDYERGNYELARQRFEYILKIDPSNQAAADKLRDILLEMARSEEGLPTPKPTVTIAITATPDNRQLEEIYAMALAYRDQQNWDAMLTELDAMRGRDKDYHAVELDGLYYIAYRNRGMHRIQVEGNLEGGIFDLNRAELYGPLDIEARNYRDWSISYITGVSFWEIDWQEVLNYLSPLVASAPYLSDSSHFTVQDRVATAQVEANLQLVETARFRYQQGKWCDAYDLYNEAGAYIQLSQSDLEKFQDAKNKCFGIEPTQPTEEATATPES